ncbi:MAG: hypothetical protein J5J04_13035 [Anaerolineae bacterium]|nr:hypothetical protein [Anaerolineae bacterium]
MTTQAEAVDAADAPRLRRELRDAEQRLHALQVAAGLAAADMERAAALLAGHYLARGYADSLRERADELRAAITRSEA